MTRPRNWIIGSAVCMFLVFGGRAAVTGQDIPDGIKGIILMVLTSGMAFEPLQQVAQKFLGSKPEGESEKK